MAMDVYRPFPADEPSDAPAGPPHDGAPEPPPVQEEDEVSGPAERAAPNTEHPGGHLHGTVARLNRPRRFGFLRADDGVEVFFHASALDAGPSAFDGLRPGQEVEFDCHQDEQGRGLAATAVTIVGEPPVDVARPPRPPRQERAARPPRGPGAAGAAGDKWHVVVLHDRYDAPVSAQLQRLLNERGVKPGQFTLSLVDREEGPECWVAFYTEEPKR